MSEFSNTGGGESPEIQARDEDGAEFLAEMLGPEEAAGFFAGEGEALENEASSTEAPSSGEEGGAEIAAGLAVELAEKLAQAEAELAEAREQLLRKAADFENFRKRMNQEKQRAIEFANESLLLDLIPALDDLERAILFAAALPELSELPAGKNMLDGLSMIEKRLVVMLESKWGLKRFSAAGEPFDPNIHEAVFMETSPEAAEPVVAEDFAKGYALKERVIRSAKVKVLMPERAGD